METITVNGKKYQRVTDKATTHVYAILDRSGSMGGLEQSTVEGYNGFIKNLREATAKVTTVLFDNLIETIEEATPVHRVKVLDTKTYFVRGGTALIDAVVTTLQGVKLPKGDKGLVLIITDGEENSSRKYDTKDMKSLVERFEGKGNWSFTYIGANQDAWAVAQKFGFAEGNVATYRASVRGTAQTYDTMSLNTMSFASSAASSTRDFFSKADKEQLKDAK